MTSAAPDLLVRDPRGTRERMTAPVVAATALLAASLLLHLRDPHATGSYLVCPWLFLTGTYCPGCGGLRAVNDLTRGDLGAAVSSNALLVGTLPLLLVLWARWARDRWQGVRRVVDHRRVNVLAVAFGVLALAFGVLRNVPGLEWLTP